MFNHGNGSSSGAGAPQNRPQSGPLFGEAWPFDDVAFARAQAESGAVRSHGPMSAGMPAESVGLNPNTSEVPLMFGMLSTQNAARAMPAARATAVAPTPMEGITLGGPVPLPSGTAPHPVFMQPPPAAPPVIPPTGEGQSTPAATASTPSLDHEALLMKVATGLSAIANAVSGGAGDSIHIGQLGSSADPKYPDWDGSEFSIHAWVASATELKQIKGTSDRHAITYARIKLHQWLQNLYPTNPADQPKTWEEFTAWLLKRLGPADWRLMTHINMMSGRVSIRGKSLQQYISEFMMARRTSGIQDEGVLKAFFLRGLEPDSMLMYSVMYDLDPNLTLEQLIERTRRMHTGVAHPMAMVGLAGRAPHGASMSQLPPYSGPTVLPNPNITPMSLDVLSSQLAAMADALTTRPQAGQPATRLMAMEPPYMTNAQVANLLMSPEPAPPNRSRGRSEEKNEPKNKERSNSDGRSRRILDSQRGSDRYPNRESSSRSTSGSKGSERRGDSAGRRPRSSSREKKPIVCWNCQEDGHREADCPNPRRTPTPGKREGESPKRIRCYCCGESGHIAPNCPIKKAMKEGRSGGKGGGK